MKPTLSEGWVQDTTKFLYGFFLRDFQLEVLLGFLNGGIYSLMMPTDFGKSMILEQTMILGVALDPNSRNIGIKITASAAVEAAQEVARKLQRLAERYPEVEPKVRYLFGEPVVTNGFWVAGVDPNAIGRDINRTIRFYGLGARELQGKRAKRTLVDDVERQEEAMSEAMSKQLRSRISAVTRTMQDYEQMPDMLWAILGTPTHSRSIHFQLARDLEKVGVRYREIKITPFRPDGTPTWADRLQKMEIHRRTMDKREYAAAYEMEPLGARNLTDQDIDRFMKEPRLRLPQNEQDFRKQLLALAPQDPFWARRLEALEFYVGWDPAGDGEWAVAAIAILGEDTWILRSHLGIGDTWDQVRVVADYIKLFPSAIAVIERNGTQKSFIDVFEEVMPDQMVVPHGTYGNKHSEVIGIPALMASCESGTIRLPWGDPEAAEQEYEDLIEELKSYSSTSHPHVIPAVWFPWYWSRKHERKGELRSQGAQAAIPGIAQIILGGMRDDVRVQRSAMPNTNPHLRVAAQKAWGKRL